jgi:predicted Rossmann fold flavoprotein
MIVILILLRARRREYGLRIKNYEVRNMKDKIKIAVVGGGPAGMMAAIQASNENSEVFLFEKNSSLGKKLLITGKGRCNITNEEKDVRKFIQPFGKNSKFLFSSFSQFFNEDLLNFLKEKGLEFNYERGGRVFPKSNSSQDVLNALKLYIKEKRVGLRVNKELKNIKVSDNKFILEFQSSEFIADKVIISGGGKSYPGTGSSGEIFEIIKGLGHKVVDLKPSLVPILVKEVWIKDLEGLSLKNVEAKIIKNNKILESRFGEMIFTDRGVSGPIILSLSKYICREDLKNTFLSIDFKPVLSPEQLTQRIRREMNDKNIFYKSLLKLLLPNKIIPYFLKLSEIKEDQKIKHLNKEEIKSIVELLKDFRLKINSLSNFGHAIVTSGGVDIKEINPQTMESKLIPGLYFAGEVIDLDAETGGYNLQAAFSTGYVAGNSCKK